MANLNISIAIDSKQAETELKKFQDMLFDMAKNFENLKKSLSFGDETIKEAQKLSKSIQNIETNVKQVTQTTENLSRVATAGFSGLQKQVEKTRQGFIGLQYNLKSILTDAMTLMNFQLRWYAARQIVFGIPRAIKAGIGFEADIDKAQAQLLRYSAMEGQVSDIHRQVVSDIVTYSRQLAINLPVTFDEVVKSADRLLAAGVDIDTVKGSLASFAKLQVAFPEIEPEKFTTAIIGFLNTFRRTPGLKDFENDAQRIEVILDKLTVALAKGVIAPKDINVVIQHLGQMSQAAGFSIDQMLALSVMVTNLGSKAGPAARALRGLIDSLATPKGIENLEKIGVQLDRSKTIASQFTKIIEGLRAAVGTGEAGLTLGGMEFLKGIAPTERRSALIALIRELETYQDLVGSISQSQGALDRTAGVMTDTLSGQWQILKNLTKEFGAALTNSDLLRSGLSFLIDTLKVLGFWLSGIAGILSVVVDGFKWLWHSIAEVTNPIERLLTALVKAATGDLKGAWQEIMRTPDVYYLHEQKAAEALRGSLERAAKETKTIQDVLFGRSEFAGGKGEIKGGGIAGESGLPSEVLKTQGALKDWQFELNKLQAQWLKDEEGIFKKAADARKWLADKGMQLSLSEFDYKRAKILEEYDERAKVLGWTDELYKVFQGNLKIIDNEELEYKRSKLQQIQDLEISHQLAVIDLKEQSFELSKSEANDKRLKLYKQDLANLDQAYQKTVGIADKDLERLKIHEKIDDINSKIAASLQLQKELSGSMTQGMKDGWRDFIDKLKTDWQDGFGLVQTSLGSLQNTFSNIISDSMKRMKDWRDYVNMLLDSIRKKLADILAQWLLFGNAGPGSKKVGGLAGLAGGLLGLLVKTFKPGTPAGAGSWNLGAAPIYMPPGMQHGGLILHSGGAIQDFIPQFHSGGYSDEIMAILKRKEYVVSERGVNAVGVAYLDRINRGEIKGGNLTINVPITVESGNKKMVSELRSEMEETAIRVIRRHS